MSATEPIDPVGGSALDDYPEFELNCLVDENTAEPTVTVFSGHEEEMTTHWITIDAASAVDIESVR